MPRPKRGEAKRITIALDEKTLEWLDEMIEQKIFYNYQHGVDLCFKVVRENNLIPQIQTPTP